MKALLAVLSLVSAQFAGAAVLATVGKAKITTEDFQKKLNDVKKQASNPPTPEQYLEDLIRYEVGVQEAEKMKLADDPLVKERFKQVLYNSLLEKELGKKVEAIKINDNEMKGFYKKNPELHIAHILI
jgi:peptidyl-prolyl cis-trans isomerase C/peptidyl-prolyl cis-trans isomerase D